MLRFVLVLGLILSAAVFASEVNVDINDMYLRHHVVITVPADLHAKYMPPLPELTKARLLKRKIKKSTTTEEALSIKDERMIEEKYNNAMRALEKDGTFEKIKEISKLYNIDPIHVAGAIIGEHTFNVDILDKVQNYVGLMYKGWLNYFDRRKSKFHEFLKIPEINVLLKKKNISDSDRWLEIANIYETKYAGKDGYPATTFLMAFFDPLGSGKSYGLGQLSPYRVLIANDVAHRFGGIPYVDVFDTEELYRGVLDKELSIHYICATIWVELDYYKKYANFDLSQNPGMTATLYNIGYEKKKAIQMYQKNSERIAKKQPIMFPEENYYGWYINHKRKDIEGYFNKPSKDKIVKK